MTAYGCELCLADYLNQTFVGSYEENPEGIDNTPVFTFIKGFERQDEWRNRLPHAKFRTCRLRNVQFAHDWLRENGKEVPRYSMTWRQFDDPVPVETTESMFEDMADFEDVIEIQENDHKEENEEKEQSHDQAIIDLVGDNSEDESENVGEDEDENVGEDEDGNVGEDETHTYEDSTEEQSEEDDGSSYHPSQDSEEEDDSDSIE